MTLKRISEALGVSITTVSKVLNNYGDVSDSTRQRVLDYVKKTGFTPNSIAASLRTKESKIVGLILPNVNHYFFNSILQGVLNSAEKAGYLVVVLTSKESYELEKKHIERLLNQKVDGIFISLSEETYNTQHLNSIIDSNVILIQYDKISKLIDSSKVVIDDREAAYLATQHLIDKGKKRIVHLRGPLIPQVAIDRFLGYKSALEDSGIPFDRSLVLTCPQGDDEEGFDQLKSLHEENISFDGVFAHADLVAVGALRYLKRKKIKIPQEVAVIGFSNWMLSEKITPSLSTVDQPGILMGEQIFEQFARERLQKVSGNPVQYKTKIIPTNLVVRESS